MIVWLKRFWEGTTEMFGVMLGDRKSLDKGLDPELVARANAARAKYTVNGR